MRPRIVLLTANLFKQLADLGLATVLRTVCPGMSQSRKSKVVLACINCYLGKRELGVGARPLLFAVCLG